MKNFSYLITALAVFGNTLVSAQSTDQDLFDLSLEALMNIEIVSASKKAESSFKSPLSSSVLTRDEINASGATTIEEALRLFPGLLVREESNGNFDVHIRGNDNLPPGNFSFYSENSMSLIMIDGRPVYNYTIGGTFWESLPISIVDVERIEVVRGPATALYGPNAVTGAINIITKKPADDKLISLNGGAQIGNKNTRIFDASVGASLFGGKFKIRASGNYEYRDRDQETYYAFARGEYVPGDQVPDFLTGDIDPNGRTKKAKDRKGLNLFVDYMANENINFSLSGGTQESWAQTVFNETSATPLSNRETDSKYVNFVTNIHGLNAQVSYNTGTSNILAGTQSSNSTFDFDILATNVEYNIKLGKLELRPGINYQQGVYTDLPYGGGEDRGYLNAERKLSNLGYFLRLDYKPIEKLRLIAAIRNDHYNVPNDDYLTYQFIGTYNLSENHMVRALYSKANRGPFMVDSYLDYSTGNGFTSPAIDYIGNDSLNLPVMDMIEVGYRGLLSSKITMDIELFHTMTSSITSFEPTYLNFDLSNGLQLHYNYLNLDLKARQIGATFSFNFAISKKIQLRAYGTIQQSELLDYDKKLTPIIIDPSSLTFALPETERMDTEHKQTPRFYGGVTGNFRPVDKLNIFAGLYYLGKHTYRHEYAATVKEHGEITVNGKALFNLKASYMVYKNNSIFVNARNLFNNNSSEFGFSDGIGGLYLAGINLSF